MRLHSERASCALLAEAGAEIHYFENPPFPMIELTLKAECIQCAAGNPAMVEKLREVVGR